MDRSLPLSAYLGVVGMPGVTAYIGLLDIGQPKSGETVVVSAAGGAVGGVVGQIAKIHGCRAVGIAGGPEKCHYVVEDLGFDACVDYKAGRLREDVKETTPQGIDVYFDNVGGEILDTILSRMNPFGRIPLCGVISQYNAAQPYGVKNTRSLLINRIKLQGFLVFDYSARWPAAIEVLSQWVSEGKIKYRETVAAGLQSAPEAFIGMLAGKNFGKQIVNLICKCSQPSSPRTFPGTGKSRKRVSAANVAQEAAYWTTTVDSTGRALRGQHNYVLHFPSGQLPPNNAVVVIGRVLVESDSDVSTADGLAKQIQLRPLNQE
jgi:hypothetical protein